MPLSSPIQIPSPLRVKGVFAGFHSLNEPATQTDLAPGLTNLIWVFGDGVVPVTGLVDAAWLTIDSTFAGAGLMEDCTLAGSDLLGTVVRLDVFFTFEVLFIIDANLTDNL
jgi:hypothetical protein